MSKITLDMIAAQAGVSVQTVANALGGRQATRPAAAQRAAGIRALAERLGYRPESAARATRTGRTMQVGVVLRNAPGNRYCHPVAFEALMGINEGLMQGGYVMSVVRIGEFEDPQRHGSRALREHMLDGLIALSLLPPAVEQAMAERFPAVVWCDAGPWLPTCCLRRDERRAGRLAVEALAAAGFRRLVYLGSARPSELHYSGPERWDGAAEAAAERGLELAELPDDRYQSTRDPAVLARELTPDTGVVASDIYLAQRLAYGGMRLGRCPGRDYGLACCDDARGITASWPDLARASFDRFDLGLAAAAMLLRLLDGDPAGCASQTIAPQWIAGATAGRAGG
ncbi:MAG: LacI family transcriptional regulator [Planctomycetes bacterium]|nr:LacI family transcriptional regulator [Planctomycetota bacterium]